MPFSNCTGRELRGLSKPYDVLIASIGYEARATYIAKAISSRVVQVLSAGFDSNHVLHYESNLRYFSTVGDIVPGDSTYARKIADVLRQHARPLGRPSDHGPFHPVKVCVDISSMSRPRLAATLLALYSLAEVPVDVDWLYAPAHYSAELQESGPVQVNDAIHGFEGWGDPMLPLCVVVGLGLEGELVSGVLDELEPTETWLFEPFGFAKSYDRRVRSANIALTRPSPLSQHQMYNVTQPYTSFLKLSSLVNDLAAFGRIVLLPLGPKIFALMCFLLAIAQDRSLTVWRLSADNQRPPVDRVPAGQILGLRGVCS
jgi:hypothetical protein